MSYKTIIAFILFTNSFNLIRGDKTSVDAEDVNQIEIDLSSEVCSARNDGRSCSDQEPGHDAFLYLKRYGYIPENKSFIDLTDNEFSEALVEFQHFVDIEVTGILDDNTIEVMKKERCPQPDIRRRTKRKRRTKRSTSDHKWVPYNISDPQMPFNWFVNKDDPTYPYAPLIEEAGKVWSSVADVNLRHLEDPTKSYYHTIIFNVEQTTAPYLTFTYDLNNTTRKTKFKLATDFDYHVFDVTIKSSDTPQEILNKLRAEAVFLFVHIWGHILGLSHSETDPNSVMYPIYENRTDPTLSQGDIIDIQTLYGMRIGGNVTDLSYLNKKRADWHISPDLCEDSRIDSILEMPDKTWVVFRATHYYEIGPNGFTLRSPRKIIWDFPNFFGSVDASVSWDDMVFLFHGNEYFKYKQNNFIEKKLISDGFPGIPDGPFDDVFIYKGNQKTYFFKGDKYWKYDSTTKSVPNGFPKSISSSWKGIPENFDAAISSVRRHQTYFFKGNQYWRFDGYTKQVMVDTNPPYPRNTDIYFFKCRNKANIPIPGSSQATTIGGTVRPTPLYDPEPKFNQTTPEPKIIDDNKYWETILIVILVIAILVIVIGSALIAYLYFGVLRKMTGWNVPHEEMPMTDRPSDPQGPVQTISKRPLPEETARSGTPPTSTRPTSTPPGSTPPSPQASATRTTTTTEDDLPSTPKPSSKTGSIKSSRSAVGTGSDDSVQTTRL